jgi:NTE family protein
VYVTAVTIEGLDKIPNRVVETELKITPPVWMTADDLDDTVDRVYKYDDFERVGYSVEPSGEGSHLALRVVEKSENLFRVGLRYDSETNLALLLNATFRNLLIPASALAWDFRVGDDIYTDLRYFFPVGRTFRAFGLMARANVSRESIDVYEGDERVLQYRTTYPFGEFLFGTIFASRLTIVGGVRGEYIRYNVEIGPPDVPTQKDAMLPFFGGLRIDTLDRTVFPTSGLFVNVQAEAASTDAGSDRTFTRYIFDWRMLIPLPRNVTLMQTLYLGTTKVGDPPPVYYFTIGGINTPYTYLGPEASFLGLERFQLAGTNAQAFGIGVQWECYGRILLQGRWNIGNTFDEWNTEVAWDNYVTGGGITLGLNIPAAPIEFTMMTGSENDFMSHLTIGYRF